MKMGYSIRTPGCGRRERLSYVPLAEPTPASEPRRTRRNQPARRIFTDLAAQVKLWLETPPGYTTTW